MRRLSFDQCASARLDVSTPSQLAMDLFRLDKLGHSMKAAHRRRVEWVFQQFSRELPVDLQGVHREALEFAERRDSSTNVVQRHLSAPRPHLLDLWAGVLKVRLLHLVGRQLAAGPKLVASPGVDDGEELAHASH